MELQVDTGLPGNTYFGRLVTPDGGYVGAENSTKLWYDEDSEEIRIGYGSDYSRFLKDGSAVFNDVTGDSLTLSGKMTADSLSAGPSVSDFSGNVLVSDGVKLYTAAGPALTFDDADNQLEVTGGTFTVAGTIQATGLTTPAGGVGIELLWVAGSSRAYIQAYDRDLSQYKSMYFAGSQIVLSDSGADRLKIDGNIYIGDVNGANYITIFNTGLQTYHGTAGVPYGSMYGDDIAWTQSSAAQNTWYTISDADIGAGPLLNVTFQNNQELKVGTAGHYVVTYNADVSVSIANKHIEVSVSVDGTPTGPTSHVEIAQANQEKSVSGVAILDLAALDLVSIEIRTTDAGTPNISVEHINVALFMVGGT